MLIYWKTDDHIKTRGLSEITNSINSEILGWAKGYFFDSTGRMHQQGEIAAWVVARLGIKTLASLAAEMNGCFTVVLVDTNTHMIEVATDRFSTVPVYSLHAQDQLVMSDNFWEVAAFDNQREYDEVGIAGMLYLGITPYDRTLLKNIRHFAGAGVHGFRQHDGKIIHTQQIYYSHTYRPSQRTDATALREEAAQVINHVFSRYARAIQERGWTAHIPLSGGLDSRLLTAELHQNGTPLSTFSYGSAADENVQVARDVAAALQIPHRIISVTSPDMIFPARVHALTRLVGMRARFTIGIGASLSLSGFDSERVAMPGHPGNLTSGENTKRGATLIRNRKQLSQFFLNNNGVPLEDATARRMLPSFWHENFKYTPFVDELPYLPGEPISNMESWEWILHASNLLALEMLVYETFGPWMLPYFDYELIDFFNTIPFHLRTRRQLHVDAILTHTFRGEYQKLIEIPLCYGNGKHPFQVPTADWRENFYQMVPPSILGDYMLMRQTRSIQRAWKNSWLEIPSAPTGPDPIAYWWHNHPALRKSIIESLETWDGLGGLFNIPEVARILQEPMPQGFLRYGVTTLLTLQAFDEHIKDLTPINNKEWEETGQEMRK